MPAQHIETFVLYVKGDYEQLSSNIEQRQIYASIFTCVYSDTVVATINPGHIISAKFLDALGTVGFLCPTPKIQIHLITKKWLFVIRMVGLFKI